MKLTTMVRLTCASTALALLPACEDNNVGIVDTRYVAEATFDFSTTPTRQTIIALEAVTGSVEIFGTSSGSDVEIHAVLRVRANSQAVADDRLNDLDVRVLEGHNAITVETVQPRSSNGVNYEVDYTIWVPREMHLDVAQVTGSIFIRQMRGDMHVQNVTGSVALDDAECAAVTVDVVTGTITSSMALPRLGTVRMHTTTGSVALSIPRETSATLTSSVTTGSISLVGLDVNDSDPRDNVFSGILGEGEGEIELSSVTGSIQVTGR